MKANDFRIGNTIDVSGIICNITCMEEQRLTTDYQNHWYLGFDEIEPIPLNEEWLLRLGFDSVNSKSLCESIFIVLDQDGDLFNIFLHQMNTQGGEDVILLNNTIKYVHSLQNLCYALNGRELTPKQ